MKFSWAEYELREDARRCVPFVGNLEVCLELVSALRHAIDEARPDGLVHALPKERNLPIGFLLQLLLCR